MKNIKKHPKDMTTEEIAQKVFHPKIHEKLKEIVYENKSKSASNSSSQEQV